MQTRVVRFETVAARLAAAEQSAVTAVDDAREAGRQMLVEAREARKEAGLPALVEEDDDEPEDEVL